MVFRFENFMGSGAITPPASCEQKSGYFGDFFYQVSQGFKEASEFVGLLKKTTGEIDLQFQETIRNSPKNFFDSLKKEMNQLDLFSFTVKKVLPSTVLLTSSVFVTYYVIKYFYELSLKTDPKSKISSEEKYFYPFSLYSDRLIRSFKILGNTALISTGLFSISKIVLLSLSQIRSDFFFENIGKEIECINGTSGSRVAYVLSSFFTKANGSSNCHTPNIDSIHEISWKIGAIAGICSGAVALYNFYRMQTLKQSPPVCPTQVRKVLLELVEANRKVKREGGYFQNVLIYGPSGTGKTKIAEQIARHSQINYVKVSAQMLIESIHQHDSSSALDFALSKWKNIRTPTLLLIDDIESVAPSKMAVILKKLLPSPEEGSKNLMVVLETSEPKNLDRSILSSFDCKIGLDLPDQLQRRKILRQLIIKFFPIKERTIFYRDGNLDRISKKTEGFSGRDLFKLINAISGRKLSDWTVVSETIDRFVEQEKQLKKQLDYPSATGVSAGGSL